MQIASLLILFALIDITNAQNGGGNRRGGNGRNRGPGGNGGGNNNRGPGGNGGGNNNRGPGGPGNRGPGGPGGNRPGPNPNPGPNPPPQPNEPPRPLPQEVACRNGDNAANVCALTKSIADFLAEQPDEPECFDIRGSKFGNDVVKTQFCNAIARTLKSFKDALPPFATNWCQPDQPFPFVCEQGLSRGSYSPIVCEICKAGNVNAVAANPGSPAIAECDLTLIDYVTLTETVLGLFTPQESCTNSLRPVRGGRANPYTPYCYFIMTLGVGGVDAGGYTCDKWLQTSETCLLEDFARQLNSPLIIGSGYISCGSCYCQPSTCSRALAGLLV